MEICSKFLAFQVLLVSCSLSDPSPPYYGNKYYGSWREVRGEYLGLRRGEWLLGMVYSWSPLVFPGLVQRSHHPARDVLPLNSDWRQIKGRLWQGGVYPTESLLQLC